MAKAPSSAKALKPLVQLFTDKKQTLGGIDLSPDADVVNIFQLFNVSGIDYKGQVSSAYGERGFLVEGGVKVDVLDLLMMLVVGIPVLPGLSVKLGSRVGGSLKSEALVLLERFPSYVNSPIPTQGTILGTGQMPTEPFFPNIWCTRNPINLLVMYGKSGDLEFELTAEAKFGLPSLVSIDELGIELSASASVNGKISGKFIRLNDYYPKSFPRPSDTNIQKDDALQRTIYGLLTIPDKKIVKRDIDAWINEMVTNWLTVNPVPEGFKERQSRLKQVFKSILVRKAIAQTSRVYTRMERLFNDWFLSKINQEIRLPVINTWLKKWSEDPTASTSTLLIKLTNLQAYIIHDQVATPVEKRAALNQIYNYIDLLNRCNRQLNPDEVYSATPAPHNYLTYFNLFAFAAGAGANAEAIASVGLAAPEGLLPGSGASITVKGEGSAPANVDAQFISYRFQSSNMAGGVPMVHTQDTWMTYRRYGTDAVAATALEFSAIEITKELGKAVEKSLSHYSISYKSRAVYWMYYPYRFIKSSRANSARVKQRQGSGISYGMSVSLNRLVQCAKAPNSPNGTKLINNIAKQLILPVETIKKFISDSQISTIDPAQDGFPDYVFIESNWAFPENTFCTLGNKTVRSNGVNYYDPIDGFNDSETSDLSALQLDAIRLRFRIADMNSSVEPLFKLGLSVKVFKINIDFSNVRGAGHEAMFDYYTQYYRVPKFNQPQYALQAQEESVPPVVLLHL